MGMAKTTPCTMTIEFLGPWGCGKSTIAAETRSLLIQAGYTCPSAGKIAFWRAVAGMWTPESDRMDGTRRAITLMCGAVRHPLIGINAAAMLTTAWVASRRERHAWGARKFSVMMRTIALLGRYDVIVWDEGPVAMCAAAAQRNHALNDENALKVLRSLSYGDSYLVVNLTTEINTLLVRQQLRYPPKPSSRPQFERIARLNNTLSLMDSARKMINQMLPGRLLDVDASRSVVHNAKIVFNFINDHLSDPQRGV
jgi:hypothetical protein